MTTSCRFPMAVQILVVLAYHDGDRVTSAVLGESVNTHPVIIRRLLNALQRANLVETARGPRSGSRLNCSPRRINLADVYRAVEDATPFALPARASNPVCPVGGSISSILGLIIASARAALEHELRKTTIADLLTMIQEQAKTTARRRV